MLNFQPRRQRGITLVEMMVSVAVGLILLSGIISIFVSNKQAYRLQESTSVLNENARYALNQIQYHLRMGDHWGGVETGDVEIESALAALGIATTCTQSNVVSGQGFVGFDGGASSPLDCIPAADYRPNTDVLVIRYGEPERVQTASVTASADIYVCTAIGRRSIIYQGTAHASLPSDMCDSGGTDPPELTNYEYHTVIYFIRNCASQDLGTAGVCDAADDDTPTLARLVLDGTTLVQEDVIAGVEQLQITYGILNEGTNPPQITFQDAATTQANAEWGAVASIQVSLIVRGEEYDAAYQDTRTFNMYGGFTYDPASADEPYRRKLYNFAVQIRNQTRA